MPIANLSRYSDPIANTLKDELFNEWANPDPNKKEPVIVFDREIWPNVTTRVFVIWDKWGDLSQKDRTNIIIDAHSMLQKKIPVEIRYATGLTWKESEELAINFELEEKKE